VIDCLVRATAILYQERIGAILLVLKRRLRRAVLVLAEANLIDESLRIQPAGPIYRVWSPLSQH
jgi:hypothetical protein